MPKDIQSKEAKELKEEMTAFLRETCSKKKSNQPEMDWRVNFAAQLTKVHLL